MISVAQAVEGIVKHKPYLSESLAAGIINISGFGPTDTGRSGEIIGEAGKCRCNRDGVESVGSLFTSAGTGTIKQVAE